MPIESFADKINTDNNHMVRVVGIVALSFVHRQFFEKTLNFTALLNLQVKKMAGVGVNGTVTELDLRVAMRTVKRRFVVGLLEKMEESVHRFNIVMGVNESDEENKQCINHFFHNPLGATKHHSNSHPAVSTSFPVLLRSNQPPDRGICLTGQWLFCHDHNAILTPAHLN